jgi:hypothetical protein
MKGFSPSAGLKTPAYCIKLVEISFLATQMTWFNALFAAFSRLIP